MSYIDDLKDCIEFTLNTHDHALHPLIRYAQVSNTQFGRFNGQQSSGYLTLDQLEKIPTKILKTTWWTIDPIKYSTGQWDTKNNPILNEFMQIRIRVVYLKPTLEDQGYTKDQVKTIIKDACRSSRTVENPDGDLF